jgi:hypothetical protein
MPKMQESETTPSTEIKVECEECGEEHTSEIRLFGDAGWHVLVTELSIGGTIVSASCPEHHCDLEEIQSRKLSEKVSEDAI